MKWHEYARNGEFIITVFKGWASWQGPGNGLFSYGSLNSMINYCIMSGYLNPMSNAMEAFGYAVVSSDDCLCLCMFTCVCVCWCVYACKLPNSSYKQVCLNPFVPLPILVSFWLIRGVHWYTLSWLSKLNPSYLWQTVWFNLPLSEVIYGDILFAFCCLCCLFACLQQNAY